MHQATRPGHGRIFLEVIFAPMDEKEFNERIRNPAGGRAN